MSWLEIALNFVVVYLAFDSLLTDDKLKEMEKRIARLEKPNV